MSALAGRMPYLVQVVLTAVVYVVVAKMSLSLAIPPGYATAVWPPSGIALVAILLFGNRGWHGVAIGAVLANVAVEASPISALVMASGNTLEALVGAALIRRHAGDPARFRQPDQVFAFVVVCAISAVVAASVALVPLLFGHDLTAAQAWRNWWTWWQGDFAGMLLVTPLLLSWTTAEAFTWPAPRRLEAIGFFVALAASALAISRDEASHFVPYALTFVSLPFILWAAFRFGQREATAAVAVVCAVAVWYTVQRRGELSGVPLNELLLILLTFISIVGTTGLVLVALVSERPTARTSIQLQPTSPSAGGTPVLERELREAIDRQHFELHYQPKVDLDSRRVVGVEALLRWNSPRRGSVAPMQFIPLLEESGMILEVGKWALRRALLDQQAWAAAGLTVPRVAVNVSPVQLRHRDFVALVREAIGPAAVTPLIDLELTETLVMENVEDSIAKLASIRALGIGVAIDDFGTGYSSLAYLTKLPAQTLKIDRFFIQRMLLDDQSMTLVQTIISLAQALSLTTVAEGVESDEQADMLETLRCNQMQGYLVSRPVPANEVRVLLGTASA